MTELQKLEQKMDKRFDELTALLSDFANDVYRRFDTVEERFKAVERRLMSIETRLDNHAILLDRLGGSTAEPKSL